MNTAWGPWGDRPGQERWPGPDVPAQVDRGAKPRSRPRPVNLASWRKEAAGLRQDAEALPDFHAEHWEAEQGERIWRVWVPQQSRVECALAPLHPDAHLSPKTRPCQTRQTSQMQGAQEAGTAMGQGQECAHAGAWRAPLRGQVGCTSIPTASVSSQDSCDITTVL